MSKAIRTFWLITLLFFGAGCSGSRTLGKIRTHPDDPYHDIVGELDPGDRVRVSLDDGSSLTGVVAGRTPNFLTVKLVTEPFDERDIHARRIVSLEKQAQPGGSTGGSQVAGIVVGVLLIGGMAAIAVGDQMDGFMKN